MPSQLSVASSFLFLLFPLPEMAFVPGPQLLVGFCWYLTSLISLEGVIESGCCLKLTCKLHISSSIQLFSMSWLAYWDSLASNFRAGEPSLIFSILTGFFWIQPRMTSWISFCGAVVLSEPGQACERETLCPACKSAELRGKVISNLRWIKGKLYSREIVEGRTTTVKSTC